MKKVIITQVLISLFFIQTAKAASSQGNFKLKIKAPAVSVDQVNAISSTGRVFTGSKSGTTFTINIPTSSLKGASLYAVNKGRFVGPIYSPFSTTKGLLYFVKAPKDDKKVKLSSITLTLKEKAATENFLLLKKAPKGVVFEKKTQYIVADTPALGLNTPGNQRVRALVRATSIAGDSDGDGVVDTLDVDADGDGITNIADSSTTLVSSGVSTKDGERVDVPYTSLFLSLSDTINWHISGSLSSSAIDSVVGGENKFAIAYFFNLPPDQSSGITGGHVICGSDLTYCKPTVGSDTGTGRYSGFSEGNQSLSGQLWSSIQTDGSEYSLETFNTSGGGTVYAASIQPRVGTSAFRPGDNYRVDFTNSTGAVVTSKTLTLPPYFLTVPAIRSYNTASNDASTDVLVNYSDSFAPGSSNGNPIVLSNSGEFSGKLRLNMWRLQRLTVPGEETGDYKDYGNLNYGVLINGSTGAEFSCGELYSNLSSTLTESASQGTGGSFSSQQGANLWPLVDSAADYSPSSATDSTTVGNNTISFTIDLTACRARSGLSAGVHTITITAAGPDTGHGANRAAQMVTVNIP